MRTATTQGIRRVLRNAGFTVLSPKEAAKFEAAWEEGLDSGEITSRDGFGYPVTEHDTAIMVSETDGHGVCIGISGGRMANVETLAARVRDALTAYTEVRDFTAPAGTYRINPNSVDENYQMTVMELHQGFTNVSPADPWTRKTYHSPYSRWDDPIDTTTWETTPRVTGERVSVNGQPGTLVTVPDYRYPDRRIPILHTLSLGFQPDDGDVILVGIGDVRPIDQATETQPESTDATTPTPHPVGTRVRVTVGGLNYSRAGRVINIRPGGEAYDVAIDGTTETFVYADTELDATETVTQDDASTGGTDTGHIWHDFRESADYRSNPTTHSDHQRNRYAAVRAALVNSGFHTPRPTLIVSVSTGTLTDAPSLAGRPGVLSIIATSSEVGARAVIGYVWITTTTNGEMILNVRDGVSSLHVISIRETLTSHGWRTVPVNGTGHYSYRLTRTDTAPDTAELHAEDAEQDDTPESGVTDCACCGAHIMASNIRVPNYCDDCTAHGGKDCPGSGAGVIFDTAWHCPGGICDGTGCTGDEHMPRPDSDTSSDDNGTDGPETDPALMGIEPYGPDYRDALTAGMTGNDYYDSGQAEEDARTGREIEDEYRGETDEPESDAPARTDQGPTGGSDTAAPDDYGVPCATTQHRARPAVTRILITHTDDTHGIEHVCSRCARYYITYSGLMPHYKRAVIIPDNKITLNVGYIPGMTISVWPVENVPAMTYNTYPHGTPAQTRYAYMVEYCDDVMYAGTDITTPKGQHPARAAFNVATHIIRDAHTYWEHTPQDGSTHDPCDTCTPWRDIYRHREDIENWRNDWAGERGIFDVIMRADHADLTERADRNATTPEEMITQYFELIGAGNDFTGPLGDARWQGYLTWAKIIGADGGKRAAGWVDVNDCNAQTIVDGADHDIDPEVMDGIMPRVPNGEYADDYGLTGLCEEMGLTEDDESDDGALWNAFVDAFISASEVEVIRRARLYVG